MYQLDMKSVFLYGELSICSTTKLRKKKKGKECKIEEDIYITLNKLHVHGTIKLKHILLEKDLSNAIVTIL